MVPRILLAGLMAALACFGQAERGTFNGSVIDSSGAAVAGANVKIFNMATGVELNAASTEAGVFRAPSLSPGTYRITVSAPGFKTAVR